MSNNNELGEAIETRLQLFESKPLREASLALLKTLGYQSDKTITVEKSDPKAFIGLLNEYNPDVTIDENKALFSDWKKADILFQLTDDELVKKDASLKEKTVNTQSLQSYMFFAVELNQQDYARGKLVAIARQLNRVFPMPVMVLIKYGKLLSVAVINRRQSKIDSEKDVLGKAAIIRDISFAKPHTGHIQILSSLAMQNLIDINNFDTLHAAWEKIFNVELLSKKFYNELSNWYFWAINEVSFPGEPTIQSVFKETGSRDDTRLKEKIQEHNAKNVIRMITRFLFVWFIKEKHLIPEDLFKLDYLKKEMLKDLSPYHEQSFFKSINKQSHYYKAILQNLFFATLNQDIDKRAFRRDGQNRNATNLLRYKKYFKHPDKFIELTKEYTPFMNGGLFECLDKPDPNKKGPKGGDVILYEDGFSDHKDNQLRVPDYLFFGRDEDVDLSTQYGSKAKKYKQATVKGLIKIFNSYKFTITENTPLEQDVALDPELLGKVFENLLASYNPETKTTARKQTGSFYTPRGIVDHMVDKSLIAYLENKIKDGGIDEKELDKKFHELLSYDDRNPFLENQSLQEKIIQALGCCKILDPACGSGAFPMGILQKMVHILQKVDPNNACWKKLQMDNAIKKTEAAFHHGDKEAREQKLIEINEAFDQQVNDPDYARKLFLIENCIYGVDIQPIATQISKLRFFISLVADQKVDKKKNNFGIRPLPNLETKFVAANTLIGIKKKEKQMTLYNPEIKEKEIELREVRHRMFSAKTPRTKRGLRAKDQQIREEIRKLLIEDGWDSKTIKQLSGWDPYDQNMSSVFFDPEWMFGIKSGFDVVIGNPPYVPVRVVDKDQKEEYSKYTSAVKGYDLYVLFIETGINFLVKKGVLSFINPNRFINTAYGEGIRKILLKNKIEFIVDFNDMQIFEGVTNYPCILQVKKDGGQNFIYRDAKTLTPPDFGCSPESIEQASLNTAPWSLVSAAQKMILKMMSKNSNELKKFSINMPQGLRPRHLKSCFTLINSALINEKAIDRSLIHPVFTGKNVKKYTNLIDDQNDLILYPYDIKTSKPIDISKYKNVEKYLMPFSEEFANIKSKKKNQKWFEYSINKPITFRSPKIVFPDISKTNNFYLDEVGIPYLETCYAIFLKDVENYRPFYVILNSMLVEFYIKSVSPFLNGRSYRWKPFYIESIPISNSVSTYKDVLAVLSYLLENSFSKFAQTADAVVFELYFSDHMKKCKIDILQFVKKDLREVMQDRDFDKLPDSEKENVINQLHTRWTHPDSEVRSRIELFSARSPDILKPILESRQDKPSKEKPSK